REIHRTFESGPRQAGANRRIWGGHASEPRERRSCYHLDRHQESGVEGFESNWGPTDSARPHSTAPAALPPPAPILMAAIMGRNKAMTMLPTTTARQTIMMGSNSEVITPTALSTSSS